ncbi:MAG: arginase family protein [Candidatus Thorarchaeota archaeon]|nr:arginase family protein [Candidatus Thorarchaeota archaeon]
MIVVQKVSSMQLRDELNGYLRLPRKFFGIPEAIDELPDIGILGVPYDLTSSHTPGCRFAPDEIRSATDGERSHSYPLLADNENPLKSQPLSRLISIEDIGDLEVMGQLPESAKANIAEAAAKLSVHRSYLLFLGGDHFVTYPLLKGVRHGRPARYGLIYFDSHADFYKDYAGYSLSHATPLRRLVEDDIVRINDVLAFDIRCAIPGQRRDLWPSKPDGFLTEEDFLGRLQEIVGRVDILYVSVDMDVLNPADFSGVSHPESGGLSIVNLAALLRKCFETGKVQFADVVEYNPLVDKTGTGAIMVRDVVKEILTGFAIEKGLK